jgi:hypothetical protein
VEARAQHVVSPLPAGHCGRRGSGIARATPTMRQLCNAMLPSVISIHRIEQAGTSGKKAKQLSWLARKGNLIKKKANLLNAFEKIVKIF